MYTIIDLLSDLHHCLGDSKALTTLLDETHAGLIKDVKQIPDEEEKGWRTFADIPDGTNAIYRSPKADIPYKMVIISKKSPKGELAISDVHGDLGALFSFLPTMLEHLNNGGVMIAHGDILDGICGEKTYQLAALIVIFLLMQHYPKQFYYIRGNHEADNIDAKYIFTVLNGELPKNKPIAIDLKKIAAQILNIFEQLPRLAISKPQRAIYVHAGLPILPANPRIADFLSPHAIVDLNGDVIPTSCISFIPQCYSCFIEKQAGQVFAQEALNRLPRYAYIFTKDELFYFSAGSLERIEIPVEQLPELQKQIGMTERNKKEYNPLGPLQLQKIKELCGHYHYEQVMKDQVARYATLGITSFTPGHAHLMGHLFKTAAYNIEEHPQVFATFSSSQTQSRSIVACKTMERVEALRKMLPENIRVVQIIKNKDDTFSVSIAPTQPCYCLHREPVHKIMPLEMCVKTADVERMLQGSIAAEKWLPILNSLIKQHGPSIFSFFSKEDQMLDPKILASFERVFQQQDESPANRALKLEKHFYGLINDRNTPEKDKKILFTVLQDYHKQIWKDEDAFNTYRLIMPSLSMLHAKATADCVLAKIDDKAFATRLRQKEEFWQQSGLSEIQKNYKLLIYLAAKLNKYVSSDKEKLLEIPRLIALVNNEISIILRHLTGPTEVPNLFHHNKQFNYPPILDLLDLASRQEGLEDVTINILEHGIKHGVYDNDCLPICYYLLIYATKNKSHRYQGEQQYTQELLKLSRLSKPEHGKSHALCSYAMGLYYMYIYGDVTQAQRCFKEALPPISIDPFPPAQYQLTLSQLKQFCFLSIKQANVLAKIHTDGKITKEEQQEIINSIIIEQRAPSKSASSMRPYLAEEQVKILAILASTPLGVPIDSKILENIKNIISGREINPLYAEQLLIMEGVAKAGYIPAIQELSARTNDPILKRKHLLSILPYCESSGAATEDLQRIEEKLMFPQLEAEKQDDQKESASSRLTI